MTLYDDIFGRFLQKITDYKMMSLCDIDLQQMWHGWLKSALSKQKIFHNSITMDDDNWCFEEDLTNIEQEILAVGMVIEWLEPQVNSVVNTLQMFSSSDEKFYSQANHLSELRNRLKDIKTERKKLIRDYQYNQFAQNGT